MFKSPTKDEIEEYRRFEDEFFFSDWRAILDYHHLIEFLRYYEDTGFLCGYDVACRINVYFQLSMDLKERQLALANEIAEVLIELGILQPLTSHDVGSEFIELQNDIERGFLEPSSVDRCAINRWYRILS